MKKVGVLSEITLEIIPCAAPWDQAPDKFEQQEGEGAMSGKQDSCTNRHTIAHSNSYAASYVVVACAFYGT